MSVKTGKEAAITGLREYQQELLARIAKLKTDLQAVEHSLALLGGADGEPVSTEAPTRFAVDAAGPQEVVEAFLKTNVGRFFKPSMAARLIRKQGYTPKNLGIWATQVAVSMKRLRDKGVVISKEEEGKRVFGIPGEPPGAKA